MEHQRRRGLRIFGSGALGGAQADLLAVPAADFQLLKIPEGITVTSGYIPTLFHRSNTKQEAEAAQKQNAAVAPANLDPEAQTAFDRIAAFLKKQNSKK